MTPSEINSVRHLFLALGFASMGVYRYLCEQELGREVSLDETRDAFEAVARGLKAAYVVADDPAMTIGRLERVSGPVVIAFKRPIPN